MSSFLMAGIIVGMCEKQHCNELESSDYEPFIHEVRRGKKPPQASSVADVVSDCYGNCLCRNPDGI
jgi:hypothetical protein